MQKFYDVTQASMASAKIDIDGFGLLAAYGNDAALKALLFQVQVPAW